MIASAFFGGVALHVLWRWLKWVGSDKDRIKHPLGYWDDAWPLVSKAIIGDIILYFLWLMGTLNGVLPAGLSEPAVPSALVAGFFVDLIGKDIIQILSRRG